MKKSRGVSNLSRFLDRIPQYIPNIAYPILRPCYPLYEKLVETYNSRLSERQVETTWGFQMTVDPTNKYERKITNGVFERDIIKYFLNHLVNGTGHFADIGANIGLYSLLYTTHADGRVDAFEPLPSNIARLRKNVEANNADINIHAFALGTKSSQKTLTLNPNNPAEASLSSQTMHGGASQNIIVDIYPLKEVMETPPDVMKIDVEGAEYNVLSGGRNLLSNSPPDLLVEVHPKLLKEFGHSVSDLVNLLQDIGYNRYRHVEEMENTAAKDIPNISDKYGFHIHSRI